jgi:hypothetical protein
MSKPKIKTKWYTGVATMKHELAVRTADEALPFEEAWKEVQHEIARKQEEAITNAIIGLDPALSASKAAGETLTTETLIEAMNKLKSQGYGFAFTKPEIEMPLGDTPFADSYRYTMGIDLAVTKPDRVVMMGDHWDGVKRKPATVVVLDEIETPPPRYATSGAWGRF